MGDGDLVALAHRSLSGFLQVLFLTAVKVPVVRWVRGVSTRRRFFLENVSTGQRDDVVHQSEDCSFPRLTAGEIGTTTVDELAQGSSLCVHVVGQPSLPLYRTMFFRACYVAGTRSLRLEKIHGSRCLAKCCCVNIIVRLASQC